MHAEREGKKDQGLYIMLLSIHGLVRGEHMELGRDPDTGGQILYVVDLARALARHPSVGRVDLVTRQVLDRRENPAYAEPEEDLGNGARIIRLPFGPKRYLRKEALWPYLFSMIDQVPGHLRRVGQVPDIIHGHYADAGLVGGQLSRLLGVPFLFTGHSLGRVKKQRLEDKETDTDKLEKRYRFSQRIEAEEFALDTANQVITSTVQEVEEQYRLYDNYEPDRMVVIPPGVDLDRFGPPGSPLPEHVGQSINRFLDDPDKPLIMAMARPDERKNFETLLHAYGQSLELQARANLLLVLGNRDDIAQMQPGARRVLNQVLVLIDRYDLYGKVAYPKKHGPDDVPLLYQFAAKSRGIFINPALTEPFGLTLLEASASGLPIVATNDGGPRDILASCQNGLLVDPLSCAEIQHALMRLVEDPELYDQYAAHGIERVKEFYSWSAHSNRYMRTVSDILDENTTPLRLQRTRSRLPRIDRMLITDIDNTLLGNDEGLARLVERLRNAGNHIGFGIATGRSRESVMELMQTHDLPQPDLLITSVGTAISYGEHLTPDTSWEKQISYQWDRDCLEELLNTVQGLQLQESSAQSPYKISYEVDTSIFPTIREIKKTIRENGLRAKLVFSLGMFLDVIPIRAGDGLAIRHLAFKWGLPLERVLVAGDSGNDEDMLAGNTLGLVVGNHSPELNKLRDHPRVYFADAGYADGILEGIDHYQFFEGIEIPPELEETAPPDLHA